MKLIQKLKIWKELKRLEAKVHESPSPSTFVDLGQVYINLGMHEQTLQLADEGLALFPNSDELRKLRRFAKKHQLNDRVKELANRIRKGPDPDLYRELAGVYLELGDYEAAHETCQECIRRFSEDVEAYVVLAKAHLTNFYRDLVAHEGLDAVEKLEKVIQMNPANAKARRLLAEVLYRVGATNDTRRHLESLRSIGELDAEGEAMLREVGGKAGRTLEDVSSFFHQVEKQGEFVRPAVLRGTRPDPREVTDPSLSGVREALAQIADCEGVRKATYIKGTKALVKGDIRDGKDSFLRIVRVVAKASQRACRRMDIGNFSKGIVDSGYGNICLCSYGDVLAAVLCDEGTASDELLDELQELVAGSLYMGEGSR